MVGEQGVSEYSKAPGVVPACPYSISNAACHSLSSQVLYTFDKVVPVVQASVNASRTLLGKGWTNVLFLSGLF